MGRARATRELPGLVGEAEAVWYDPQRWAAFVEGLDRVVAVEGDWPHAGSSVVWESIPAGRGRVTERVVSHEPREGQELEVEDEQLCGRQRVRFTARDDGCAIALELDYRLKAGGPLMAPVDLLFVRRSVRDSLRRTLQRFAHELGAEHAR